MGLLRLLGDLTYQWCDQFIGRFRQHRKNLIPFLQLQRYS